MRRTSLRSSAPVKRRRLTPRKSERIRDPEYLSRVAELPCQARTCSPCEGRVEVDHMGRRPLGRKCSDYETGSLCTKHHRERTDFSGYFRDWSGERMRAQLDAWIAETKALLGCVPAEEESS